MFLYPVKTSRVLWGPLGTKAPLCPPFLICKKDFSLLGFP